MKFMLMPRESSWWIWLATDLLLVTGLVWTEFAFVAAILLSAASAGFHLRKYHSYAPYSVQIRVAFTALMIVCFAPFLRWFYWLLAGGAFVRVLFGYCMMARMLSLMPWNRAERVSLDLLRRTFFTPPTFGNAAHGLSDSGHMRSVCEIEARVAARPRRYACAQGPERRAQRNLAGLERGLDRTSSGEGRITSPATSA